MSKENIQKFYQAAAADAELRTRLSELFKPYKGQEMDEAKKAALVEEIVLPLAAEKGLPFTVEELRQYESEMIRDRPNGELSMDELEAVAGGESYVGAVICFIIGAGLTVGTDTVCYGLGFSWGI